MPRPRTKLQKLHITLEKDQAKWGRDCLECQSFWEWWRNWGPALEKRSGFVGRPRSILAPQSLHQAVLYCAIYVNHLREMQQIPGYGAEQHLSENDLAEWLPAVRRLRPYLRHRNATTWGEPGVISARRWRGDGEYQGDVQYHAVRRLLAIRLDLSQKSLLRRFDEMALWGPAA